MKDKEGKQIDRSIFQVALSMGVGSRVLGSTLHLALACGRMTEDQLNEHFAASIEAYEALVLALRSDGETLLEEERRIGEARHGEWEAFRDN